jgi:hypothetical protein
VEGAPDGAPSAFIHEFILKVFGNAEEDEEE